MPPTKEVIAWWKYLAESKIYMALPKEHPARKAWLRSTTETPPLVKAKGRPRTKAQIRDRIQRELFGGRFKCHNCDLRFKTRAKRRHHEKYSHKHVGRIKAIKPGLVFVGFDAVFQIDSNTNAVQQISTSFNPPHKRHNTRGKKP